MKKLFTIFLVAVLALSLAACSDTTAGSGEGSEVDVSRIRLVIGSTSTGGDTYQNADTISRYLEDPLGTNIKVDAVGAVRAFQELGKAKNDGSTVMFFHDMAYLGVEYGSIQENNKLENWTIGPVVSTNPGNAFLAKGDAPYDTMAESAEWLKNNPDETITVAIESGGVSEITFDGYYLWVKEKYGTEVSDRIKAYVTGSQEDKNQALWDGNADIINGSIGGNNEYTKDGVEDDIKMKFLGITAGKRVEGYDIPTFAEQGITVNGKEFVFDKEFFFLMPKDVEEDFASKLDKAVAEVEENPDYAKDLGKNAYITNYVPAEEAKDYLREKRATFQNIIKNAPELDKITN
ncbi:tripartite tricarboxylate transporter substrate-binding protein [Alkalihalobacillus sp. TS-13]|uniref:tripartite tricarboxylate transporter substrate-binding protein n=1 Tax=Alkalihalobacillus sp. TS-13 TaxID=2842455 RepID=UPI001C87A3D7|nr:tripartite tricarboxylate transporter substrate-binding protein [Alkalihalobacillus sp. TS-13]